MQVIASKGLQKAFDTHTELCNKAGDSMSPKSIEEAITWINGASTFEQRQARKLLSYGMLYGSGPASFIRSYKND